MGGGPLHASFMQGKWELLGNAVSKIICKIINTWRGMSTVLYHNIVKRFSFS